MEALKYFIRQKLLFVNNTKIYISFSHEGLGMLCKCIVRKTCKTHSVHLELIFNILLLVSIIKKYLYQLCHYRKKKYLPTWGSLNIVLESKHL